MLRPVALALATTALVSFSFAAAHARIVRDEITNVQQAFGGRAFGEIGTFARYENFDTQFRMPTGYVGLPEFDRDAWVVGATYWPDPDVAVKFDYSIVGNRSTVVQAPNSVNIGLGWWF